MDNLNFGVRDNVNVDITGLAGGGFHSLALNKDGTVAAFGDGTNGQLGDGSTTNSDTPVTDTGWVSLPESPLTTNTSYLYSGDGIRMGKAGTLGSNTFAWDTTGQIPQILSDGTDEFIYGSHS